VARVARRCTEPRACARSYRFGGVCLRRGPIAQAGESLCQLRFEQARLYVAQLDRLVRAGCARSALSALV
jgi:hypothetical protein